MKLIITFSILIIFSSAYAWREITTGYYTHSDTTIVENDSTIISIEEVIGFSGKSSCYFQQFPWRFVKHPESIDEMIGTDSAATFFRFEGKYCLVDDTIVMNVRLKHSRNFSNQDSIRIIKVIRTAENIIVSLSNKKQYVWTLK